MDEQTTDGLMDKHTDIQHEIHNTLSLSYGGYKKVEKKLSRNDP